MGSTEDLEPGRMLGSYRLDRLIGSGAMGQVFAAEDTRLGRAVALKILPPEIAKNPSHRARFKREARLTAALTHPGLVTVHSIEEEQGFHFLSMELVQGEPLSAHITETGLPFARIVAIATRTAEALSAAHEAGITHRDLKPDNIMLAADGRPKILDFGLAKPADRLTPEAATDPSSAATALTSDGQVVGTLAYMAPEQTQGKPADGRADIFSFGVVLYEMATGRRPFAGESYRLILSILKDQPTPLRELNPALPSGLQAIVDRCLAKDPSDRYQTARELSEALAALGATVPAEAPRQATAPQRQPTTPAEPVAAIAGSPLLRLALIAAAIVAIVVAVLVLR